MLEDVLAILGTTPGKLRREITALPAGALQSRPAPHRWSVQEILAHLDDVEALGMRARVEAIIRQDRPELPLFDQEKRAVELRYDRKDPFRSLEHFTRQRRANVKWLRTLRPADLRRPGLHPAAGEITAGEIIHAWALHDLGHLRQILEIERSALWPRIGNLKALYKLS
jgi:hypothetical protein